MTTTVKLRYASIVDILRCARALEPYKFSGAVRLRLASNIHRIQQHADILEEARLGLLRGMFREGENEIPAGDPRIADFHLRFKEILAEHVEIELDLIHASELDADNNDIPLSVLCGIQPLLGGEAPPRQQTLPVPDPAVRNRKPSRP